MKPKFYRSLLAFFSFIPLLVTASEWEVALKPNPEGPGQIAQVTYQGKPAAQFVYGEGQLKPYLHLFSESGDLLTKWSAEQQFPHHRGVFIGWNRIKSELGQYDLWHLSNGGKMRVKDLVTSTTPTNATITAEIEWLAGKADGEGSALLIQETRRLTISRESGKTQVDAQFLLRPVRDLELGGDLQHAGIHFRASSELSAREEETSYLWDPPVPGRGGKVESPEFKWCRLIFPIGKNWYAATELNSPQNPTQELSWRAYGRFGFFFKKELKKGESLPLSFRFVVEPAAAPAAKKHTPEELLPQRTAAEKAYAQFLLTAGSAK